MHWNDDIHLIIVNNKKLWCNTSEINVNQVGFLLSGIPLQ